jgi:hypothetical protein
LTKFDKYPITSKSQLGKEKVNLARSKKGQKNQSSKKKKTKTTIPKTIVKPLSSKSLERESNEVAEEELEGKKEFERENP